MSTPDPSVPAGEPDIRAYLETRTAGPSGFSPTGERLLISSDVPGSAQLYALELGDLRPDGVPIEALRQVTDLPEPAGGGFLPVPHGPEGAAADTVLIGIDAGGNERHQLYLLPVTADAPAAPVPQVDALSPLVVDPEHIHRSGGVTRDGSAFAYATNRRTGTDFDVWVRDLATGSEQLVHAPGGWTWAGNFSPDGRYLALGALTQQPGDSTLHLLDRADASLVELAPHSEPAEIGSPSWLPDSSAFFFSHDVGRDMERDAIVPITALTKEIAMQFVFAYDPGEFYDTLHLLADGKVDPTPLITSTVDLDGVPAAFDTLGKAEEQAKILVAP